MSDNVPAVARYALVDFGALLADVGVDLVSVRTALAAQYADIDARNARNTSGLSLPCHVGCDACCHESVFLTPLEFVVMWDWAQTHLDVQQRDRIVEQALTIFERHRDMIMAFDAPPADGAPDHWAVARQLRFRCPLLGSTGECLAYPVRELYARLFGCSFNEEGGVYGCELVGKKLGGAVVTLVSVERARSLLAALPLTGKRQVYFYYFNLLYGGH